jgi:hypothetical protein
MANTLKFGNGEWYGKKDTILAYNDENNNYKPLPFDFSRDGSATVINKDGLIETVGSGEPRVDYKDDSKGALLLEPSRTNSVTYSEDFSQSVWNKTNCTIIPNNSISPNGTQNADKLVENNIINSFSNRYSTSVSYTSGLKYTISIFAKSDGRDLMIRSYNGSSDIDTIFDLSNGIILSGSTGEIKDYGNGWYRCSHTITAQSTINTSYSASFVLVNNSSISYQGDGTSGVYVWGAMIEQGNYPTSYIPTQGSAVTRVADDCLTPSVPYLIGQTEGTIFWQGEVNYLGGGDGYPFSLSASTTNFSNAILLFRTSAGNLAIYITKGGAQFSSPLYYNDSASISENDKYAIGYAENDLVVYKNGVQIISASSGQIPSTNFLFLNSWSNTFTHTNNTKQVQLYNTRLSNSELQALTTI